MQKLYDIKKAEFGEEWYLWCSVASVMGGFPPVAEAAEIEYPRLYHVNRLDEQQARCPQPGLCVALSKHERLACPPKHECEARHDKFAFHCRDAIVAESLYSDRLDSHM